MSFDSSPVNMIHRLKCALFEQVKQKLETISEKRAYKYTISLKVIFQQLSNQDILTVPPVVFNTEAFILLAATNIEDQLHVAESNLMQQVDNYERNGSGWILYRLNSLDLNTISYNPLRAYHEESSDESD